MILEIVYMQATVGVAAIVAGSTALVGGALSFGSNKKKEKAAAAVAPVCRVSQIGLDTVGQRSDAEAVRARTRRAVAHAGSARLGRGSGDGGGVCVCVGFLEAWGPLMGAALLRTE